MDMKCENQEESEIINSSLRVIFLPLSGILSEQESYCGRMDFLSIVYGTHGSVFLRKSQYFVSTIKNEKPMT